MENAIKVGDFIEFDHKKHTFVGIVEGAHHKSKGGVVYAVTTAEGVRHEGVATREIHFTAPAFVQTKENKGDSSEKRLRAYDEMLHLAPAHLGDPFVLELCWEIAAEDESANAQASLSLSDFVALVDGALGDSPIELYRTFRLLTSEVGRVFFTKVKHGAFKVRAEKSVEAAKKELCSHDALHSGYESFCFAI